ncbi:MAG TPA: 1,2-phenylacetyl-CoA epoxidase subunit PaaC [Anaerolineales bacterium]|nr:1,2-phenylacetyl-CoA epoxidase subunit PaaC [Anaerolineales bacterium]
MRSDLQNALRVYLLAMADDELILGHRDSEWCGHAPILEEDIAFANIALDEIGHASIWYSLLAELIGEDIDKYPDELVFSREYQDFRNVQVVEMPKGDWAYSMLRQYLFDSLENKRLDMLTNSQYQPIAEAAGKIRNEEIYHLRHTSAWVKRLGLGTEESNHRLQRALDEIWSLTRQLFDLTEEEELLISANYVPPAEAIEQQWEEEVLPFLEACGLSVAANNHRQGSRTDRNQHTTHLRVLVTEMQSVARLDPEARW